MQNVFIFWYPHIITNGKLRIFKIVFFINFNIYFWFYIRRLYFNSSIIFIVVFFIFFAVEVLYLQILFFRILINLSPTTGFPSLFVEYIAISFFQPWFQLFAVKFTAFINPPDSIIFFQKTSEMAIKSFCVLKEQRNRIFLKYEDPKHCLWKINAIFIFQYFDSCFV